METPGTQARVKSIDHNYVGVVVSASDSVCGRTEGSALFFGPHFVSLSRCAVGYQQLKKLRKESLKRDSNP